jgi:ABC-2 type transport system permease protein
MQMTLVQFKLFLREPVAFFFTLIFPAFMLLLFGAIWGNEPFPGVDFGYIDFQVPALAGLIVGTVGMISIPVTTATAREQQILRRYRATPMRPSTYILAEILVNLALALVSMIILVILGRLIFDLRLAANWGLALGAFLLSTLTFFAAGYIIASLAPTARVAQVAGNLIYFPMLFLSGASIPLNIMPESVQNAAQWLPMTHVVTLMQDVWLDSSWNGTSAAVLGVILIAGGLLAARLFRWE